MPIRSITRITDFTSVPSKAVNHETFHFPPPRENPPSTRKLILLPPPSPPPIRIAAKVYRWRLATVASCIGGGQHWRRKFSRETGTETERRECASTALLIRARRGARAHTVEEKGRVERSVFSTSAGNATGNGKLFNLRLRRTSDSVTPLKYLVPPRCGFVSTTNPHLYPCARETQPPYTVRNYGCHRAVPRFLRRVPRGGGCAFDVALLHILARCIFTPRFFF